jgi:hypothetical protein
MSAVSLLTSGRRPLVTSSQVTCHMSLVTSNETGPKRLTFPIGSGQSSCAQREPRLKKERSHPCLKEEENDLRRES